MPQIFHPSTNTFSKASIFGAVFILAGIVYAMTAFFRSSYATNVNVPIVQPVPFSHEHHVAGLGIDCRYCHVSVEESSFADIPPIHTCMTCHSQIWTNSEILQPIRDSYTNGTSVDWVRVNDLPDYVYFNHSIHVAKGFGCETCHGEVDQQPLTWKAHTLYMEWCLDCHRNPEKYIRPKEAVFEMNYKPPQDQLTLGRQLVREYSIPSTKTLTDCTTCHR